MAKSQKFSFLKTPSGPPFDFNFHVTPGVQASSEQGHTMIVGRTSAGKTVTNVFKPNAAASAGDYSGLKLTDAEVARITGQKRGGQ